MRRIAFLVYNFDGRDGVIRSVLTLAEELARTHDVQILSLYRRSRGPAYPVPDAVRVRYLQDRPPPSPQAEHGNRRTFRNLRTDLVVAAALRRLRVDVLVSTRPSLHARAARFAPRRVLTVGQDHLNYVSRLREPGTMGLIELAARRGLDAFVTLTLDDETDYTRHLAGTGVHVRRIPNALSWPVLPPVERRDSRTVVAVGRLVGRKGMGRLIRAFAPVARGHPEWSLDIYGTGRLETRLRGIIDELGVADQVTLRGHHDDIRSVLCEAAVFASASRAEGFPMVMLEAMSTGLPLAVFDCPRGPSELVDATNGVLVPEGDIPGLTAGLERLVGDGELRQRMGEGSRERAGEYAVEGVAARWTALFEDLLAGNRTREPRREEAP